MELFPYQREGAAFLAARPRALLADEMGLGKSAQAIAACDEIDVSARLDDPTVWPRHRLQVVVVVCPASVVENWKREFAKFSKAKRALRVVSYNRAATKENLFSPLSDPEQTEIDCLILDEAHYLKSATAKRTKAIFGPKCDGKGALVERAKHVFALTGTPTPNHPGELWPLLRALAPETIDRGAGKPLAYWGFVQKYCRTRDNGFGLQILGGRNLIDLKRRIAPFVLRRKKDGVMKDLPPIRFDQLFLEGDLKLPAELLGLEKEVAAALDEHGVEGLAKIATHVAALRRATGLAKVKPAVEWIREQLESGLKKLVVFAHHREVIEGLQKAFPFHVSISGQTPTDSRGHIVDRFQNEPAAKLFLGQIQAAGTGITLTAASDALFVESSWVPAENEQAAMRIHRIGQRNACVVRFATLANSIDEKIEAAVMRKSADIARLFG